MLAIEVLLGEKQGNGGVQDKSHSETRKDERIGPIYRMTYESEGIEEAIVRRNEQITFPFGM
jgi:hypothetical protein